MLEHSTLFCIYLHLQITTKRGFDPPSPPIFEFFCIFHFRDSLGRLFIELKGVSQPERIRGGLFIFYIWVQEIRELRIPTRKTNPIHNDVPENTTFLLLDQPSGEEKTTGTLISKIDEVAINAKTANWKAIVMFLILQARYHLVLLSVKKL